MPERSSRSLARRVLIRLGVTLAIAVLILALAEGAASAYLFASDFKAFAAPYAMIRPHTTYDTLLGWVNRKSFVSPNEFGPGLLLTTNAQGFRDSRDVAPQAAPGETRIVCSGDSFTLASGIAEGHHWCAQLEKELPGLRTMNMGQGHTDLIKPTCCTSVTVFTTPTTRRSSPSRMSCSSVRPPATSVAATSHISCARMAVWPSGTFP